MALPNSIQKENRRSRGQCTSESSKAKQNIIIGNTGENILTPSRESSKPGTRMHTLTTTLPGWNRRRREAQVGFSAEEQRCAQTKWKKNSSHPQKDTQKRGAKRMHLMKEEREKERARGKERGKVRNTASRRAERLRREHEARPFCPAGDQGYQVAARPQGTSLQYPNSARFRANAPKILDWSGTRCCLELRGSSVAYSLIRDPS